MRPTHTPFIMKTRRYDLTSAVAALILFFGVAAATPASAQDVGNAPFGGTMSVANGGGTIGAAGGTDGVTVYGGSLAGAGGAIWANGQLKAAVTTAGGAGTLSVLWDQPGTTTAFSNLTTYAIPGNGTHDISIPAPVAQATGAGIWVRFVFTTAVSQLRIRPKKSCRTTGRWVRTTPTRSIRPRPLNSACRRQRV